MARRLATALGYGAIILVAMAGRYLEACARMERCETACAREAAQ